MSLYFPSRLTGEELREYTRQEGNDAYLRVLIPPSPKVRLLPLIARIQDRQGGIKREVAVDVRAARE